MEKKHTIIWGLIFLLVFLNGNLYAWVYVSLTDGNHNIPDDNPLWESIEVLNTYNDVSVTITNGLGGGIDDFNMYDNSKLSMYARTVHHLSLYDNAAASIYGEDDILDIYVDFDSTALLKLYAYDVQFLPHDSWYQGQYQAGDIIGRWLADDDFFNIELLGQGWLGGQNPWAIESVDQLAHIQIIPEPATLVLFSIGVLLLRKYRK